MRSARCVFKGFHRERGHQPSCFWGFTGKSHLHIAIILTLCCWKDFENVQTELAITGGEKMVLVMLFSPPFYHVSVSVSGSLINLCFDSGNFLFPECSKCSLWSCQISPNCLSLSVSPFVFYLALIYAKPCIGDDVWCPLQWKSSLGFSSQAISSGGGWVLTHWDAAQSDNVPPGSPPSGVWHWKRY